MSVVLLLNLEGFRSNLRYFVSESPRMIGLRGNRSPCIRPYTKSCRIYHLCGLLCVLASKVLWLVVAVRPVVSVAELRRCVRLSRPASCCRFVFNLFSPG